MHSLNIILGQEDSGTRIAVQRLDRETNLKIKAMLRPAQVAR